MTCLCGHPDARHGESQRGPCWGCLCGRFRERGPDGRPLIHRHGQWRQGEQRRDAILAAVADFWGAKGWGPTLAEVGALVGLAAPSSVHAQVKILIDDGMLAMDRGVPRSLRLVEEHSREPL